MFRYKNLSMHERAKLKKVADVVSGDLIKKFDSELENRLAEQKRQDIGVLTNIMLEVLYLEFGFGKARMARFIERFNFISECMAEGYVSLDDLRGFYGKRKG